jgi:hypothetical protein
MPNSPKTPLQRLRCDPDLWYGAGANLGAAGTNNSAAIRGFLAAIATADPERVAEILKEFPPQ